MNKGFATFVALCLLSPCVAWGQGRLTPRWLRHTPERKSAGTHFVPVTVPYVNRSSADALALGKLTETLENEHRVSKELGIADRSELTRENGRLTQSRRSQTSTLNIVVDGKPVTVNCMLADEWWNTRKNEYSALYQVADYEGAEFCATSATTRYGVLPIVMSAIPGAGQFYKGDALKGSLLLAGCTAGGAGIIFLESQRRSYANLRTQTHDVSLLKRYAASESNLGIARNVCIGITAALYLYNLIDAGAAPGARRIVVSGDGVRINF